MVEAGQKQQRAFRKFISRGVGTSDEQLVPVARRLAAAAEVGLWRKQHDQLQRPRKNKKEEPCGEAPGGEDTPAGPDCPAEMVGSMVGLDSGKTFTQVEIKPEMMGHHLGEFSITCKPGKHGPPGLGATHASRFIPSNEGIDFSKGKKKKN